MSGYIGPKIEAFRARELRDSASVKTKPIERVDAILARRGFDPPVSLWEHQRRCALLGTKHSSYIFLLDMGLGKTLLSLALFDWRKKRGDVERMLVLTPFSSVINEWRNEAKKFGYRFQGLDGTALENSAAWEDESAEITVCTIAMFLRKVGASKGSGAELEPSLEKLVERFDFLVFDESSALRKSDTVIFKTLRRIGDAIPYRYFLTGTPMNDSPEELWPQFFLCDGGYALGESLSLFRGAYFEQRRLPWGRFNFEYRFLPEFSEELHRRLRHCSIRYEASEHREMPKMIGGLSGGAFHNRSAALPASTVQVYNTLLAEIKKAKGDPEVAEGNYCRMRQICSGYMTMPSELDRIHIKFPNNPKLDLLLEVLDQIPPEGKVLIGCWYKATADLLEEALRSRRALKIDGSTPSSKRKEIIKRFREKPKDRILIGTIAIGYGTNLPEATHLVFFESPDSHIDREQFERRVLRGNSKHRPVCIDLTIDRSVELWIQQRLLARAKVTSKVIRGRFSEIGTL